MSRTVKEWIGKTEDSKVPDRVKLRIFMRHEGKCAATGHKFVPPEKPDFDHIIPLRDWRQEINGEPHGHRESNLQPLWKPAHKEKTAQEASDRAKVDNIIKKSFGMKTPSQKIPGRPFAKGNPKRNATRPVSKLYEFMEPEA